MIITPHTPPGFTRSHPTVWLQRVIYRHNTFSGHLRELIWQVATWLPCAAMLPVRWFSFPLRLLQQKDGRPVADKALSFNGKCFQARSPTLTWRPWCLMAGLWSVVTRVRVSLNSPSISRCFPRHRRHLCLAWALHSLCCKWRMRIVHAGGRGWHGRVRGEGERERDLFHFFSSITFPVLFLIFKNVKF